MKYLYIILLLIFGSSNIVFAQFPGGGSFGGGGGGFGGGFGGSGASSSPQTLVLDTSAIYHYYAQNPNLLYPYRDSLMDNFQQYDPIRQQVWDWRSLGNLGSAAQPIVHSAPFRLGLDVGLHQYDLYQIRTDDIRFYKINQAFTQATFSQGANQSNTLFDIRFSRTFKQGLNLTIEHRRINDDGYFDHEGADHRAFAIGLGYKTKGGGYQAFLTAIANNSEIEDNGGEIQPTITELDVNGNSIEVQDYEPDAFLLDVRTMTANTRQTNREFAYTQYLYLNKRKRKRKPKSAAAYPQPDSLLLKRYDSIANLSNDTSDTKLLQELDFVEIDSTSGDTLPVNFDRQYLDQTDTILQKNNPPTTDISGNSPSFTFPPDTIATQRKGLFAKRAYTVYHRIRYATETYKFWDDRSGFDTIYYRDLQVDSRGLRHYLERRVVENELKIKTFKLGKDKNFNNLPTQRDLIEVGVRHQIHFLEHTNRDTANIDNLYLTGQISFTPNDRLKINTYGHLALLANRGDYRVSGNLFFDLKKWGNLQAEFINQLYEPTYWQHRFFNTQQEIWNNNFDKTLETSLTGSYNIPFFRITINGGYHLVTNYIYFNEDAAPQQSNQLINIFQLGLSKNIKVGPIQLHNRAIFQQSTSSIIRLPDIYSTHSLFVEGPLFKRALIARIGVDARLSTGFMPYTYQPLVGQFHLQSETELPFTPLIDAFFIAKLTRFRFLFKVENLMTFIQQEYYSQTAGYFLPYGLSNSGGMRLAISWRFVD